MLRGILYLIGALIYVIFPRDMIPDFLVGWGWIDDIIILCVLWRYFRRLFQQRRPETGYEQTEQTTKDQQSHTADTNTRDRRNPVRHG